MKGLRISLSPVHVHLGKGPKVPLEKTGRKVNIRIFGSVLGPSSRGLSLFFIKDVLGLWTGSSLRIDWHDTPFLRFKLDFYSHDLELFCLNRSSKNLVGFPTILLLRMPWSASQCPRALWVRLFWLLLFFSLLIATLTLLSIMVTTPIFKSLGRWVGHKW